jgi:hypothetical protein
VGASGRPKPFSSSGTTMFHAVNEMVAAVKPKHSDTGMSVRASATFTVADAADPAMAHLHTRSRTHAA